MRKFWSLLWFFVIIAVFVANGEVASDTGTADVVGGGNVDVEEFGGGGVGSDAESDLEFDDGESVAVADEGFSGDDLGEDESGAADRGLGDELYENPATDGPLLNEVTYRVSNIVDGDTIDVIINGEQKRIRLIGVDTPEVYGGAECFGREASSATADMLLGELVLLEADDSQGDLDKYDRLLRFVFLPDGTNFGEWLIENGYATEYTYRKDYKYKADYALAEERARESGAGMWAEGACPVGEY